MVKRFMPRDMVSRMSSEVCPSRRRRVFDIGSTSKQFAAASVILLALDGKLSLSDDVRKYVPELPDYGKTITIDHLLRHTSGLRDYTALLSLGGSGGGGGDD